MEFAPTTRQISEPQPHLLKSNPLSRKLSNVLSIPLADPSFQQSLRALTDFYPGQPYSESPSSLKNDVEKKVLGLNKKDLKQMDSEMQSINDTLNDMSLQLTKAFTETDAVIQMTNELKAKKTTCLHKQQLVQTFLQEFTLSSNQIQLLKSAQPRVNSEFFEALNHLQKVNYQTREWMMTDGYNYKEGYIKTRDREEIMSLVNSCHENAFSNLYKWTQSQLASMSVDSPEISKELRQAMKALKSRPVLFQSIMEDVSRLRKNSVLQGFEDALVRGGPGGIPRPIELHAHDPCRYVGDMLAWVHQATASEREMLNALFYPTDKDEHQQEAEKVFEELPGFELSVIDISGFLERNFASLVHPLKARMDPVLEFQNNPVTLYKLANMIQFYQETIVKILGEVSPLSVLLQETKLSAFRKFYEVLNNQASLLVNSQELPNQDLMPTPSFQNILQQLKEILFSHQSSLSLTPDSLQETKDIISAVLDPLKQSILVVAEKLSPLEKSLFTLNCLHQIQSILNLFSFTIEQVHQLDVEVDPQLEVLVQEQYQSILKQSGLASLVQHVSENKRLGVTPLAEDPNTSAQIIHQAMYHCDTFLASNSCEIAFSLKRLTSTKLSKQICKRGVSRFLETYRQLYEDVMSASSGFDTTLKLRTLKEMETLLSIVK